MASLLHRITVGMPKGIKGVARVTVEAEMLMHQDHGAGPTVLLRLVD